MYLSDDGTGRSDNAGGRNPAETNGETFCPDTACELLGSIVETACEHEHDLGLMRLLNFLDLYRVYLCATTQHSPANDAPQIRRVKSVTFESFIRDSRLLARAAAEATRQSGERVAVPLPLKVSANDPEV